MKEPNPAKRREQPASGSPPGILPQFADFNEAALATALGLLKVTTRYDSRGCRIQILRPGHNPDVIPGAPPQWEPWTDHVEGWLRDRLATRFRKRIARSKAGVPFRFSDAKWRVAMNAHLSTRALDPFARWLPKVSEWDGTERIETLLAEMFGAEDTPLNRWASAFLFRGAVLRAFRAGAKLDVMPVLIGPQGIGKSHLLSAILPRDHRHEWFSDALVLSDSQKQKAEALQGRVIVEAAEMAAADAKDLERLKAFLTRQNDGGVRMAYRRNPEPLLRRCVIVGTSNETRPLPNDPTGLRRFVPVRLVHGCDVLAYLRPIRRQLWAEAVVGFYGFGGEHTRLPRGLIPDQQVVAEQHRSRDDLLEESLARIRDAESASEGMTLREIAKETGLAHRSRPVPSPKETARLRAALTRMGWTNERRRTGSKRSYFWVPPQGER